MANCTPEEWTLKDIKDALEKETYGKKKIVIPMFQRGKRWDDSRKTTFIDSLRKQYPIGTLLFYRTIEGTQEVYTLIDGLQRGSAIKEYLSKPTKYFKINDLDYETREKIYELTISAGDEDKQKEKIDALICEYINNCKDFDSVEIYELHNHVCQEFPLLNGKIMEFGSAIKKDIQKLKDNYNDLSLAKIPAIVYTGEEETLPEIFERINSKGVPLDEYEIYAASWPRQEFTIKNEKIIEHILKKYDLLNDGEYTIAGYNRDQKRINKNVNAFEYVFGLSKYLQNEYTSLGFYKNYKDDETNPIAFQILNACFNTSHGQIKEVHKIITRFSSDINVLEEKLLSCIKFVDECIEPIHKFKGNNRSITKIFHSQYQIMSLISFVFRKKYDISSDDLKTNDDWKEIKKVLKENIWKYYVYDIITKYWGEGGTNKIHTANSDNRYLTSLTKNQFAFAYDSYSEDMLNRRESKQVPNPNPVDYTILNTIYVNTFSALDQLKIDKFDVEHIATKKQMKNLINKCETKDFGLPISHIANMCYLPEFENRSKGENNFYQDNEYLTKAKTDIKTIEDKYSFTIKDDLEWMDINYKKGDADLLKSYYVDEYLKKRNLEMKKRFLESLGFKETPIE